jgi:hypothetical protein
MFEHLEKGAEEAAEEVVEAIGSGVDAVTHAVEGEVQLAETIGDTIVIGAQSLAADVDSAIRDDAGARLRRTSAHEWAEKRHEHLVEAGEDRAEAVQDILGE